LILMLITKSKEKEVPESREKEVPDLTEEEEKKEAGREAEMIEAGSREQEAEIEVKKTEEEETKEEEMIEAKSRERGAGMEVDLKREIDQVVMIVTSLRMKKWNIKKKEVLQSVISIRPQEKN
ncbi:MAG TPA: hypothetical protein VMZ69_09285, partial [Saprospiraceae bacterium]|nr:hypothetical protein [Saprospiraceae bacterium]